MPRLYSLRLPRDTSSKVYKRFGQLVKVTQTLRHPSPRLYRGGGEIVQRNLALISTQVTLDALRFRSRGT